MSLNFYLSDLDTSGSASSAQISGADTSSFTGDVTATVDVSASVLQSLFNYYSDNVDVTDVSADDIKYRVVYTGLNTALDIDINANTTVEAGNYYTSSGSMYVAHDYVRYLADKLFNTSFGVDLFSNESDLRTDLQSTFQTNLDTVLTALESAGVRAVTDSDSNPSKKLLDQIINSASDRLSDISGNHLGSNWYKMPILAGDNVYSVFTVSAASNQEDLTSTSAIPDRTYLIRMAAV